MIRPERTARLVWLVSAVALAYAILRFAVAGVQFPLSDPKLGQIEEELTPLRDHLATGAPVETNNPRQYGATFFFVLHPLLKVAGDDPVRLSQALYAIEIVFLAIGFAVTCATLRRWVVVDRSWWPLTVVWIAILWLTSVTLYAIITVKNVEIWELALVAVALYCYLRGRLWGAGFAIAAASLAKLLPFIFLYYLLLRDRRAFLYTCAALAVILGIAHALYGPRMGAWYLPSIVTAAVGQTWALDWHENISAKGIIAKLFGHLLNPQHYTLEQLEAMGHPIGYVVELEGGRAQAAALLGTGAQLVLLGLLTWACLRGRGALLSAQRTAWEWFLVTAAMPIISPNTAFEYTMLVLGASSYVLTRLITEPGSRARIGVWITFVASAVLLGSFLPRGVLNTLTFVELITRATGYTHLSPSEQYQYYGFPFVGLCLLVASIWMLRFDSRPAHVP